MERFGEVLLRKCCCAGSDGSMLELGIEIGNEPSGSEERGNNEMEARKDENGWGFTSATAICAV